MKVLIDTNILISAALSSGGTNGVDENGNQIIITG